MNYFRVLSLFATLTVAGLCSASPSFWFQGTITSGLFDDPVNNVLDDVTGEKFGGVVSDQGFSFTSDRYQIRLPLSAAAIKLASTYDASVSYTTLAGGGFSVKDDYFIVSGVTYTELYLTADTTTGNINFELYTGDDNRQYDYRFKGTFTKYAPLSSVPGPVAAAPFVLGLIRRRRKSLGLRDRGTLAQ